MSDRQFVLIGFPHKGRTVHFSDWDERDEAAAKTYYDKIFIGQRRPEVRRLIEVEKKLEAEGLHDAANIYVDDVSGQFEKMIVSYRFGLKDQSVAEIMAAMLWDIYLIFGEDGRVIDTTVEASLLSP